MLPDLLNLVDALVRDESERLALSDKLAALDLAVRRLSQDRPRQAVEDVLVAGDGGLPLPSGWEPGSAVVHAEYPVGLVPPFRVPCQVYAAPSGAVLRLGVAAVAGDAVRLVFTVSHVLNDTVDTVPSAYREAVAAMAASVLLDQLASAAINDGDATIAADASSRRSRSAEYAARARQWQQRYQELVGAASGAQDAAGGAVVSWPGRGRLLRRLV